MNSPVRSYLAARFAVATALTMLRTAIAWEVFAVSKSAFHLGLIGIVQFLPALGLSLVGGAVADSHDRRRVMIVAEVVPLACGLLLAAVSSRGAGDLWLLYGVIFVISAAATFDNPAGAAMLPALVGRDQFPRAVAAASTTRALAFATGPAAAGFVIAEAGVGAAYAVSATLVLV
ncbi:MAG TPA: MFS transporter, partial [Candidatus Binatia bacterium]|nr:MFS transporter [Candidatus Binatia bacterium]